MTRRPYDMFDTLKAPLRGLRGTAAHLAYEEPTGLFASRLSSQAYGRIIIRKPLFLLHIINRLNNPKLPTLRGVPASVVCKELN